MIFRLWHLRSHLIISTNSFKPQRLLGFLLINTTILFWALSILFWTLIFLFHSRLILQRNDLLELYRHLWHVFVRDECVEGARGADGLDRAGARAHALSLIRFKKTTGSTHHAQVTVEAAAIAVLLFFLLRFMRRVHKFKLELSLDAIVGSWRRYCYFGVGGGVHACEHGALCMWLLPRIFNR